MNKTQLFDQLYADVARILDGKTPFRERLQAVVDLLAARVPHYDWVGFYIADPASPPMLVLGPYCGEATEHVRIPFGAGVCGRAAADRKVFVVQDIRRETNYLSCSPNVLAEIVLPIFRGADVWGELDIDSHTAAPFTGEDGAFLGRVCALVAAKVATGEAGP